MHLVLLQNPDMIISYLEFCEDPIIFEIINKNYKNHMLKLLQEDRFKKSISKLVKMKVEAPDIETACKLFASQIELMEILELNESNFIIKETIIKNTYSAIPNFYGLKTMIESIIPSGIFVISDSGLRMKFIGKNLIGGDIVLKNRIIQNIKNNMKSLSKAIVVINDPLKIIEIEIEAVNELNSFMLLESSLKSIDLPLVEYEINGEDSIPNNFPYKNIPYHQLSKLATNDFDEVVFMFRSERVKISKRKLVEDILKISTSILFAVLTHELSHALRLRFATQQRFSVKTPEKMLNEAGLYIDRAIYGNSIIAASINTRKFTIEISEKILNLVELTSDEALSAFPTKRGRDMKGGVCEYEDIDDEKIDHVEYMCTGRTIKKESIIVNEFRL